MNTAPKLELSSSGRVDPHSPPPSSLSPFSDKVSQLPHHGQHETSGPRTSIRRAIYPGSFDPVTHGHLDLIERALGIFDEVIVAVATNREKKPLFSTQERLVLLRNVLGDRPGLFIESLDGLLVEYAAKREAFVIIRGLRAVSDFEGEFQMALTNRRLEPRIETIFLAPREDCIFLSSRIVKEVASLGGKVEAFVPKPVAEALRVKYNLL